LSKRNSWQRLAGCCTRRVAAGINPAAIAMLA
jgi:hypothetical protein